MTAEDPKVQHGTPGWKRLLMTLGFTESKADSKLCFNVEGERLVMLLLYVDDLFLIENRNSLSCKKET